MSRRKKAAAAPTQPQGQAAPAHDGAPAAGGVSTRRIVCDVTILAAVFGAAVGIAELAGAANLGVSFGVGQIVFAIALTVLLTRG